MKVLYALIFLLLYFSNIQAKGNRYINYQGHIRQGNNLVNGNIQLQFRIYSDTGSLLWESGDQTIHATNGSFQAFIGISTSAGSPAVSFTNIQWNQYRNTYLEIEVNGESMAPRSMFNAVPYSLISDSLATNTLTPDMVKKGFGIVPSGCIMMWPNSSIPDGWLVCEGQILNRNDYPELFTAIGYDYGGSGGTFNLPDYRGYFLRGWDHGAGIDPDAAGRTTRGDGTTGDNVGTKQTDALQGHRHEIYDWDTLKYLDRKSTFDLNGVNSGIGVENTTSGIEATTMKSDSTNGILHVSSETRPKNKYIVFIIKK